MKSATDSCLGLIKPCSYVNILHKNEINFHWVTNAQFLYSVISLSRCIWQLFPLDCYLIEHIFKVNISGILQGPCLL